MHICRIIFRKGVYEGIRQSKRNREKYSKEVS